MKTDVVGTIAPFVIVVLIVAVIIENIGTILLVIGAIALVIFLIVIASKDCRLRFYNDNGTLRKIIKTEYVVSKILFSNNETLMNEIEEKVRAHYGIAKNKKNN